MFLIFFVLFGLSFGSKDDNMHKYTITKEITVIESPNYPNSFSDSRPHGWILQGFFGNKMRVTCDLDISESQDCRDALLLIRDGIKKQQFCGQKREVVVETIHPQMLIYLMTEKGKGSFKCKAQLLDSVENSIFIMENEVKQLRHNENFGSGTAITWVFKTNPGLHITLTCPQIYVFISGQDNRDCGYDLLQIDTEESETIKICRPERDTYYSSKNNKMIVRLSRMNNEIRTNIDCFVTSSKTIDVGHKNIASEEIDSSEFGMRVTQGTTCDCGRANKRSSKRIIFGTDAGENEFPWAVSLQYTDMKFHFCGGSIVTPRHVITAAHCTINSNPENTMVVAGVSHLRNSPGRQEYPVLRIVNHNYQTHPTRRDISVVITKKIIQYSATVGPICLPKTDPEMTRKYITAVGWGQMAQNETHRDQAQLKKAHMRVVTHSECDYAWSGNHHDPELSQICTYSKNRDICMGDSGGPVTWVDPETNRYFLVGLPSLCDGCSLRIPSIHTAVHYYHDWIKNVISENEYPEEKVCVKIN